ncbi:GntR family transcriptional regulator [Georgenia yuyongxinii]|uniref:GntR family transcriptional regulator n=1 Tax=Georgenia yuyongxinii TaxID=2589797 RepID=A0A552WVF5_9MICO|nr:GntR family transcriptional regulator [Georgenia yuyongxinii]TRW46685.1 GntR family transcriptional regulator [Georgenia yuyongxinii]
MEQPIVRTVLREEIKNRIVERIIDGTYAPGARIVESQLAKEFGTSQAPVREALRDLEGMHLIETQPHKGARVRELTPERLGQVYPVRAALEELAGRDAATRMTPDVLTALNAEIAAMRQAAEDGDPRAQMKHDTRFHEIIVETAANDVLLDLWHSLRVETGTLISVIKSDWDLHMIAEMHRPVLHAMELGDADLAATEMRAHIEFFGSLVLRHSAEPAPVSSRRKAG